MLLAGAVHASGMKVSSYASRLYAFTVIGAPRVADLDASNVHIRMLAGREALSLVQQRLKPRQQTDASVAHAIAQSFVATALDQRYVRPLPASGAEALIYALYPRPPTYPLMPDDRHATRYT